MDSFDIVKAMNGKVASGIRKESRRLVRDGERKDERKSSASMAYEQGWKMALCKMPRVTCVKGSVEWPRLVYVSRQEEWYRREVVFVS